MVARILKISFWLVLSFIFYSSIIVLLFRWVNPPISAFIQQKSGTAFPTLSIEPNYSKQWIPYEKINKNIILAVIASEDQKFIEHWGFDFDQINKAVDENSRGKRFRGASTITQQTAKNLFLWGEKDYIRKGFEAYFTLLIELIWSKRRIIEVYLNIVEFGEHVYGIEAAASFHFNKPAINLNRHESALMASVLPNPIKFKANAPTQYIIKRKTNILLQMDNLGGVEYLISMGN